MPVMIGFLAWPQYLAALLATEADRGLAARMMAKFPTAALATFDLRPGDWDVLGPGQVLAATLVTPKSL